MAIRFKCPHCDTQLQAAGEFAGKTGKCPQCKKALSIPQSDKKASSSK
ncbi:MAG: hypothetical protein AMXMBFR84_41510 [Candidatus Hydrogenedentota bacterium]